MEKELQDIKELFVSILPSKLIEASKNMKDDLGVAMESHNSLHSKITDIAEKITKAKKEIEKDISDLIVKRSDLIEENMKIFNERALRVRAFEEEARRHQYETGELTNTAKAINEKINATQKNLDGLILQKNELTEEIGEFQTYLNKMKVQEQEVKTMTSSLIEKKNKASSDYSDVLTRITEADKTLQMKNNEIIIAQDRINNLNK
jgi:chromosome segregation ATPase